MTDEYSQSRWRSFKKTGCLITADESEDSKIQPEGLKGYTVPPPLPVASSDQPMQSPIPEPNERIDLENDRIRTHPLKNRKLKILYDKWEIGKITCYDKKFNEYRVKFEDGTDDHINLDDVNGVEVILLDQ